MIQAWIDLNMIKHIIAHMISIYNDSFWDIIAAGFHKKERNNSMLSLLFMTLWIATNPIKKKLKVKLVSVIKLQIKLIDRKLF